ncbi:hypothetical protein, partial [Fulvivirga kasyanovii]
MIIDIDFADDIMEKIDIAINRYESSNGIELTTMATIPSGADLPKLFKRQNYCLPYYVRSASSIIQLSKTHYDLMVNSWTKEHPKLIENSLENTINKKLKNDMPAEAISNAIADKINNLLFDYNSVLETTRRVNNLNGIKDEEKILINHLNHYESLLRSDTKQIDTFYGIVLNKEISDLILQIYVRFISYRLALLNPQLESHTASSNSKDLKKIVWKGNQKELCELFIELQSKGWIEEIKQGDFFKTAKAIYNLFDLSHTQKNKNSDIETSFYQILKGNIDSQT